LGPYRFALQPSDIDLPKQVLQPFSLGIYAFEPLSSDVSVRRGFFEGRRRYRLPYRLWLPERPRAGVILLHGAFDYSGAFDALCPELAARGYAALAYDQRGFGETRTRGRWGGGKAMARDIAAAVTFLKQRVPDVPIFILGESMGGAIAVRAVAKGLAPGVAGMVLVAPGALASNLRRVAYALITRVLRRLGARAEFFAQRIRGDDLSAEAAIRLLADPLVLRRISPSIISGLVTAGSIAVDLAPRVRIPSLTLVGSREDVSRLRCVRKLHARLGGDAAWAEFNGGPHMLLHWQDNGPVLARIFDWLDAHAAPLPSTIAKTSESEPSSHFITSDATAGRSARLAGVGPAACAAGD
jgi:alpha-beta hydrolase superfamily lysophospholipase